MGITKTELKRLNAVLEAKQVELTKALGNREGIAVEKAADAVDQVQLAREQELAVRNLDRDSNLLRKVRSAMDRMAKGCYGTCLHCDQEISAKRLEAVPWSAYCIKCQEAADRDELEPIKVRQLAWPAAGKDFLDIDIQAAANPSEELSRAVLLALEPRPSCLLGFAL